jgi:hypothetical protein
MDLKLDRDSHEPVIVGNDIVWFSGPAEIAQAIKIHLLTIKGELFLDDPEDGHIDIDALANPTDEKLLYMRGRARDEILSVAGVASAQITEFILDPSTDNLTIGFTALTIDGDPIEDRVVI